ncbi:D-alanyl-D-alanine carboxypeptidase DacB precursor [Corynebacterium afermentans subsp. afermentans]|uniref:D-alanyl-D-alanine carboxypeptidase / D-alanyl-D-alanine-endopeptidase (Penicillin-binding protein 4) n=1 Tax=Corynebacterium afermentans TaxID=38286 RepID=A0A9X8R2B7_9CORY|nr:D-alanyl-D-alanine carboxypeptidase/D-alanyl-D-alanine-endopeptidase [Corynebacterium afermentans]OAA15869.1 D-alanyl-D-alanine carboxypeptidase [Corynebacterium afermentans subsp. afermentans]WJY57472.1 D-alanyl-D-alanine carboxypeptidase DacB precursor [Corynebacterium afermentans subsp. afermentans]SIQ10202.1 D-alanyl-D-alanine carboxypeptidase / D-alanyl-D-alanine-endopeptidase (penicillin-binding protein 4) [Corynebacterium afermentans]
MKVWTWVAGAVALAAVGGVAGFGIAAHEQLSEITHAPPYELQSAPQALEPATPSPIDATSLETALASLADNPDLGVFHGHVTQASSGDVVFDRASDEALTPASVTKVLTASAALLSLGSQDRITTEVVRGANPGEVVIKAAGDVWLDADAMDELAQQVGQADTVLIDTSAWEGMPELMPGWDPLDIDGGFVAPLQPAMLSGGRLNGETSGDVARSHTPALEVAQALAERVGAQNVGVGAADGEVVAAVESPTLVERLELMMKNSDNVYAEAIGREVALARGTTDAPGATLSVLEERGFNTAGLVLRDNSGLSADNLIAPKLLDAVLYDATSMPELRPLLSALPVAAGEGTLLDRYGDLPGRGWVRAKTGTLDGTASLAGTVTSVNGNVYTFALICNDADVLAARRAMDEFTSALREF